MPNYSKNRLSVQKDTPDQTKLNAMKSKASKFAKGSSRLRTEFCVKCSLSRNNKWYSQDKGSTDEDRIHTDTYIFHVMYRIAW